MSVDDTPDFDKTMDYTHISRSKNLVGLRNEITELRNDITELKNEITVSKNELEETSFDKTKTPVLTPGSKRINPFLRDCEVATEAVKEQILDPLGAIPVESTVLSSQNKTSEVIQINGEAHDNSFRKLDCLLISSSYISVRGITKWLILHYS